MKRPRRPAKRKVASKKITKRKQNIDWTAEDAAVFDSVEPPDGFAYQWAPVENTFRMELKGWTKVPFSRHPGLGKPLNFDGYIIYRGMALFQIAADLVEALLSSNAKKAKAQTEGNEALEAMAQYANPSSSGYRRGGFPILSPSFMESREYERPEPGSDVVDLAIKFTMPYRWRDAAAALQIDQSEYVRRRLLQSGHLIQPDEDGSYYPVQLSTKKAED